MIKYRIDLSLKDTYGLTALCHASGNGHTSLVEYLLDNQANPHSRCGDGRQALHHAASRGHTVTARSLVSRAAHIHAKDARGFTPLLSAALERHAESAAALLELGADIQATAGEDQTALHIAAFKGDEALTQHLLSYDLDIDATQSDGTTALCVAMLCLHENIALLLLQNGADPNVADQDLFTSLHYAAQIGRESFVRLLLDFGANPAATTRRGETPASLAQRHGHLSVVRMLGTMKLVKWDSKRTYYPALITSLVSAAEDSNVAQMKRLLSRGVDVNDLDADGRRALSVAAQHGTSAAVSFLLSRGANPGLQDVNGETALWWSARYGHEEVLRELVEKVENLDAADAEGSTALGVASQNGHDVIVHILLQHDCSTSSTTRYGKTPLMFASERGHLAVVELLVNFGAGLHTTTLGGDTAVSLAEAGDHRKVVRWLKRQINDAKVSEARCRDRRISEERRKKYFKYLLRAAASGRIAEIHRLGAIGIDMNGRHRSITALMVAADKGQGLAVSALIQNGADPHLRDKNARSTIFHAAKRGHASIIKLLHQEGLYLDIRDSQGGTPLLYASSFGHEEAVRLLLELGAGTEIQDKHGHTPLIGAVSRGRKAVVEMILRHGANINSVNYKGQTPLAVAVDEENRALVELLLDNGARTDMVPLVKNSPLGIAARKGADTIVELLLARNADLNGPPGGGKTPLIVASAHSHSMVVKILIEAGADVTIQDANGRTALSYAKERGHEGVVELLCQAVTLRRNHARTVGMTSVKSISQRDKYRYRPLTKKKAIRVLELDPGDKREVISFRLKHSRLEDNPFFEALSYEWREKVGTVPVQCDDKRLHVTPNCKAALERLRLKNGKRLLWIDAVCINQDDVDERNRQVAIMTGIYRKAAEVIMWIGEAGEHTGLAFKGIHTLAESIRLFDMQKTSDVGRTSRKGNLGSKARRKTPAQVINEIMDDSRDPMHDIRDLYSRPYFTRAWILQEILLADERGVVTCGRYSCPWTEFKTAFGGFHGPMSHEARFKPFTTIAKFSEDLSRGDEIDMGLIPYMSVFQATDVRDKVFAALGLVAPSYAYVKRPVVDYRLSAQETFIRAATYLVSVSRGVYIWDLGNRRSTKTIAGLPSWIPDFTYHDDLIREDGYAQVHSPFRSFITPGRARVGGDTSLHITGCIVDRVAFTLPIGADMDLRGIVEPIATFLASSGRSLFDVYPEDGTRSRRRGSDAPEADSGKTGLAETVAEALLAVLLRGFGENGEENEEDGGDENIEDHENIEDRRDEESEDNEGDEDSEDDEDEPDEGDEDTEALTFLAWLLSQRTSSSASSVPPSSSSSFSPAPPLPCPEKLRDAVAQWQELSQSQAADFDIRVNHNIEARLRWGTDLVYTEKGYFGITPHQGETRRQQKQQGMVLALVSGAARVSLFEEYHAVAAAADHGGNGSSSEEEEEREEGCRYWYEYVDEVRLHYGAWKGRIDALEDIVEDPIKQMMEIR
ncbi:ankyrin repeat-containing domain protein [Xylariomycetidae sp. FL2044]|nr:ankyrin repeat-containing domain protein [Xylariomycetidae sp. FL2044]